MKMKQAWILNHYAQEPGGAGGARHFSASVNICGRTAERQRSLLPQYGPNTGLQRLAVKEARRYMKSKLGLIVHQLLNMILI